MIQPVETHRPANAPGLTSILGGIGTIAALVIVVGVALGLTLSGGLRELTMTEAERAARAEQAWLRVQETEAALPAVTLRNQLIYTSLGVGLSVLIVGGALAVVIWLNRRASEIKPNEAGLYPVIVRTVFGGVLLHDPNRGLGPTTLYRTPTLFDALANLVYGLRHVKAPEWMTSAPPSANYPAPADVAALDRVAERVAAVQLTAAATRHPPVQAANAPATRSNDEALPRTQVIQANVDDPRLLAVARQLGDGLPDTSIIEVGE